MASRRRPAETAPSPVFGELETSKPEVKEFLNLLGEAMTPDRHGEINAVRTLTYKTARSTITKAGVAALSVLGASLSLPRDTPAYVAVLSAGFDLVETDGQVLAALGLARSLLAMGNADQLREMAYDVGIVCNAVAKRSLQHDAAMSAVRPLRRAVETLSPAKHLLTPAHSSFALVACRCKLYKDLCEIADTEVLGVMPRKTGIKVEDVLCFFYYSGIAYAAMKRWKRAIDAFSMCLVTPAAALSAVSIEAQKRRILCSLIATGSMPATPKAATTGMMQGLKKPTAAYTAIAHAFVAKEPSLLEDEVAKQAEVLETDGVTGLVKQVLVARQSHKILSLTGTFVTVALAEIASKVGLKDAAEAEAEVFKLVRLGMLKAKIDQEAGIVSFEDSDDMADPERLAARVAELVGAASELAEAVADREAELALSSDFIAHALQQATHAIESGTAAAASASSVAAGGDW